MFSNTCISRNLYIQCKKVGESVLPSTILHYEFCILHLFLASTSTFIVEDFLTLFTEELDGRARLRIF